MITRLGANYHPSLRIIRVGWTGRLLLLLLRPPSFFPLLPSFHNDDDDRRLKNYDLSSKKKSVGVELEAEAD